MALFELDEVGGLSAKIKVIGVGGGGGNAVNNMIRENLSGVEFIVANTDAQVLEKSLSEVRVQLGGAQTRGLGAGGKSEVGKESVEEVKERVRELLVDTDMVFITAGMGGGTGTGAAPVFAEIAREMGILSVAVVTKPFEFEGKKRMKLAEQGIEELRKFIDTLIVIPNQRLISSLGKASFMTCFREADNVLYQAVKGISDLMANSGYVNVDFNDVKTVMSEDASVATMMGVGRARGENRVAEAVAQATSSALLEDMDMRGARSVLINVTADDSLTMDEVNEASSMISEMADEDATIIFGYVDDPEAGDELSITVIATGLDDYHKPDVSDDMVSPLEEIVSVPDVPEVKETARLPKAKDYTKQWDAAKMKSKHVVAKGNVAVSYDDTELEIPTFLRRQNN